MNSSKEKTLKNEKGQTFIEFIFILVMLISLSFGFMRGFNSYIGHRWEFMLKIIAKPDGSDVTIP